MKKYVFLLFLVLVLLFTGCNTKTNNKNAAKWSGEKINQSVHEVHDKNFIYRLVTDKQKYQGTETVNLYAELEYIGEEEEVIISHAASPFYFDITEKTRDFLIYYGMDQPLITTTLKKGETLRESYTKNGGFSDQDDTAYIDFVKDFLKNGFPTGYYVVDGYADFSVEDSEGQDYIIKGIVDFEVKR
ncbi:hypothetical protein AB685_19750 [Bacillus sp. LL01]|uniref:hypothetical protein n=1 Tax=Bacillus sp. LL01 TaxID=1665556 RepID=UPI00064CFF19|nr:hypothetical protein [Bacillus sp. LL01]KMJ56755.1 hypothetical protein AB685_19750 [Bacillus sp. LL01]